MRWAVCCTLLKHKKIFNQITLNTTDLSRCAFVTALFSALHYKSVSEAAIARQKRPDERSLQIVNEHRP
ncbi:MAG: hypothetical protein Q8L06_16395, partial [Pseudohongiella sp.]|nr:hypothetical protein [Pseudohongiella sp.]